MALFNNFPYTDLNDINLDYTLQKLESLYTRGEQLYNSLTTWQQTTDAELEQWKASTEYTLSVWKTRTENSIDNKIQLLTAAINASFTELRTQLEAHIAEIETTAVNAASDASASATAAAGAASAASINNEQSKEWAIGETLEGDPVPSTNPAYKNNAKYYADLLGQETEQIDTNTADIADLKRAVTNIDNLAPNNANAEFTWVTGGSWSGAVGAQLSWDTTSTRRNRYNTRPVISLGSDIYTLAVNDGYHISYRMVDDNNVVIIDSGWITTSLRITADPLYHYAITGGKSDESSCTEEEFNSNVHVYRETNLSLVDSEITDINTNLNTINNLEGIDITNTISFVKGKQWTGGAGDPLGYSTTSTYKNRISNVTPTSFGADKYLITIASGFRISYRTVDANNIIIADSGWKTTDFILKANPNYTYAMSGGRVDNTTTSVSEFIANIHYIKYTPLTSLKLDVEAKNNTVDFVSATANIKAVNHRGYNTVAPENTIPAFKLSREMGFKYIETDVRFTSDNVPVLLHDATINRTARNADGSELENTINIADITYAEALTYDFGIWKSLEYAGTTIPTLAELMKLCRDNGLIPRVELNVLTVANAITMFDVINSYGMARKVEYNCNDITVAQKFLELEPQATIVYGMNSYAEATANSLAALKTNYNTIIINMHTSGITAAAITKCKESRIELETWTVNDIAVIRSLDPFVSGVTSDSLNASMILYQDTL